MLSLSGNSEDLDLDLLNNVEVSLLTAALQRKVCLKRVSLELPRHSRDCNLTAAVEAAVKSPTVTHLTLKYGHLDAIRFSHVVANSLTNGSTLRALRLSFGFTLDFPLSILFDALKNNVSLKKLVIEGIPLIADDGEFVASLNELIHNNAALE